MALFEEPAQEGCNVEKCLAGKEYFVKENCRPNGYYNSIEQQGEDHEERRHGPAEHAVADVLEGEHKVAKRIEQRCKTGY